MPVTRKILLKPRAEKDLTNIYDYGYQEFGQKKAEEYIVHINEAFLRLATEPEQARRCDYLKSGLMASYVGSHMIFFRITKTEFIVIRVLHKSMDYQRHI